MVSVSALKFVANISKKCLLHDYSNRICHDASGYEVFVAIRSSSGSALSRGVHQNSTYGIVWSHYKLTCRSAIPPPDIKGFIITVVSLYHHNSISLTSSIEFIRLLRWGSTQCFGSPNTNRRRLQLVIGLLCASGPISNFRSHSNRNCFWVSKVQGPLHRTLSLWQWFST